MVSHGLSFRALSLVCLGLLGLGLFDDLFDLLSVSNDFVFVDSEGVASTASDVELKLDDITRLQLTKHLFLGRCKSRWWFCDGQHRKLSRLRRPCCLF